MSEVSGNPGSGMSEISGNPGSGMSEVSGNPGSGAAGPMPAEVGPGTLIAEHGLASRAWAYLSDGDDCAAAMEGANLAQSLGLTEKHQRLLRALSAARRAEWRFFDGSATTRDGSATTRDGSATTRDGSATTRDADFCGETRGSTTTPDADYRGEARELIRAALVDLEDSVPEYSAQARSKRERIAAGRKLSAAPVLSCRGVLKRYPPAFTMGPVSFELGRGEILAVLGPNGCGKTSLLRILAGELWADGGAFEIWEADAEGRPIPIPVMFVPEAPPSWPGSLARHLSRQAAILGYRRLEENRRQVDHVLGQLGLEDHREKGWNQLSDGMRCRVAIAVAMLASPGVLVLDEPLGALDPISQQDLLRWFRVTARGNLRTSFVVSAHHIVEVESIADQVLIVTGDGPSTAKRAPAVPPLGTHFRILLSTDADRKGIRFSLGKMSDRLSYLELQGCFLVRTVGEGMSLAELTMQLHSSGVIGVQDLTISGLREMLWRKS